MLTGRTSIEERPQEINNRERMGDWEMDCIVSGRSGKGGLLVMIDRCSRYVLLRRLPSISQKAVLHALREMVREDAFPALKSVTTDNGTEFLDQKRLEKNPRRPCLLHPRLRLLRERHRRTDQRHHPFLVGQRHRLLPRQQATNRLRPTPCQQHLQNRLPERTHSL